MEPDFIIERAPNGRIIARPPPSTLPPHIAPINESPRTPTPPSLLPPKPPSSEPRIDASGWVLRKGPRIRLIKPLGFGGWRPPLPDTPQGFSGGHYSPPPRQVSEFVLRLQNKRAREQRITQPRPSTHGAWTPPLPDTPQGYSGGKLVEHEVVKPYNKPVEALRKRSEALDRYWRSPVNIIKLRYEGADKFFRTHPNYGVSEQRKVIDVKATKENVKKWYESLPPWAKSSASGIVQEFLSKKNVTEADWQKFKAELNVFLSQGASAESVTLPSAVFRFMGMVGDEQQVAWDKAASYAADYHVTDIGFHEGEEQLLLSKTLESDPVNILASKVSKLEDWSREETSKNNPLAIAGIVGTVIGGFATGVLEGVTAPVRPATYIGLYDMVTNPKGTLEDMGQYLSKYPASGSSRLLGNIAGGVVLKAYTAGELESLVKEGVISPQAAKVLWDLANPDVKVGKFLKYGIDKLIGKLRGKYIENPEFKFTPAATDPISPEDLISRYGNTRQTTLHVSKSTAWDEWLTDTPDTDAILLRGFPEEATGFRKEYDLLHFYKSLPTDEGAPQAYMAYAVGTGEGFGGVDFSLFGPRIKALVFRDFIDYVPPRPGEDLASYSARIGMMTGKTVIPPENIFDLSIERQVITPARFKGNLIEGEYPGSLVRFKAYRGFTYWKRLPPEPLRKIPVLRDIFSDYYKVHVIEAETLPADDTNIVSEAPRLGRVRIVKYSPSEAYATKEPFPLAYSVPSLSVLALSNIKGTSISLPRVARRLMSSNLVSDSSLESPSASESIDEVENTIADTSSEFVFRQRNKKGRTGFASVPENKPHQKSLAYSFSNYVSVTEDLMDISRLRSRLPRTNDLGSTSSKSQGDSISSVRNSHSKSKSKPKGEGDTQLNLFTKPKSHHDTSSKSRTSSRPHGSSRPKPRKNRQSLSKSSKPKHSKGSDVIPDDLGITPRITKKRKKEYVKGPTRVKKRSMKSKKIKAKNLYYELLYPAIRISDLV